MRSGAPKGCLGSASACTWPCSTRRAPVRQRRSPQLARRDLEPGGIVQVGVAVFRLYPIGVVAVGCEELLNLRPRRIVFVDERHDVAIRGVHADAQLREADAGLEQFFLGLTGT